MAISPREGAKAGSRCDATIQPGRLTTRCAAAEPSDDPLRADARNVYKVEQWDAHELHIIRLLFAGNSLDRAREVFPEAKRRWPRGRYASLHLAVAARRVRPFGHNCSNFSSWCDQPQG